MRVSLKGASESESSGPTAGDWGYGTVRVWEAPAGRLLVTLRGHVGGVRSLGLSEDGKRLAGGGLDGTVRLWDVASGRPLTTVVGHTSAVWGVALSVDGRLPADAAER